MYIFNWENGLEHLIQVELIVPNILTVSDSVVVTLTIAMNTILAHGNDLDPAYI